MCDPEPTLGVRREQGQTPREQRAFLVPVASSPELRNKTGELNGSATAELGGSCIQQRAP